MLLNMNQNPVCFLLLFICLTVAQEQQEKHSENDSETANLKYRLEELESYVKKQDERMKQLEEEMQKERRYDTSHQRPLRGNFYASSILYALISNTDPIQSTL